MKKPNDDNRLCACGTLDETYDIALNDLLKGLENDCPSWRFGIEYMQNYMIVRFLEMKFVKAGLTEFKSDMAILEMQEKLDAYLETRMNDMIEKFSNHKEMN